MPRTGFMGLRNVYPHGMVPPRQCQNRHIRHPECTLVDHRFTVRCTRDDYHSSRTPLGNLIITVSIRKVGTFWQCTDMYGSVYARLMYTFLDATVNRMSTNDGFDRKS